MLKYIVYSTLRINRNYYSLTYPFNQKRNSSHGTLLEHIRNKYSEEQGLNDSSTPEMGAYLPQSRKGRRKLRARDKRGKLARAQAAAASNAIV